MRNILATWQTLSTNAVRSVPVVGLDRQRRLNRVKLSKERMADGVCKGDSIRRIIFQHLLDQVEQLSVLRNITTHVPLMSKDTHGKTLLKKRFQQKKLLPYHISHM